MNCTRCEGTGFLNVEQLHPAARVALERGDHEQAAVFVVEDCTDAQICDCCGDGSDWYGEPGVHWAGEGPEAYAYNGGLPECN